MVNHSFTQTSPQKHLTSRAKYQTTCFREVTLLKQMKTTVSEDVSGDWEQKFTHQKLNLGLSFPQQS